jgi:hypothetical protein
MPRGSTLGRAFWRKHFVAYEARGQLQRAWLNLFSLDAGDQPPTPPSFTQRVRRQLLGAVE